MGKATRDCRSGAYARAHAAVKALWGPARDYPCIKCDAPAADWAYDWTDDTCENYSMFPGFYMPLCRSCHVWFDKGGESHRNRRGRAFRPKPSSAKALAAHPPKTEAEWDLYLQAAKTRQ